MPKGGALGKVPVGTERMQWGGDGAAHRQKGNSLLAPLWVAKQGVGRRLCPYTWDPETPLAAARPQGILARSPLGSPARDKS